MKRAVSTSERWSQIRTLWIIAAVVGLGGIAFGRPIWLKAIGFALLIAILALYARWFVLRYRELGDAERTGNDRRSRRDPS